jgi:hypothetical protein
MSSAYVPSMEALDSLLRESEEMAETIRNKTSNPIVPTRPPVSFAPVQKDDEEFDLSAFAAAMEQKHMQLKKESASTSNDVSHLS